MLKTKDQSRIDRHMEILQRDQSGQNPCRCALCRRTSLFRALDKRTRFFAHGQQSQEKTATGNDQTPPMPPKRYHPAIRVLHWLVAAMIIAALVMSTFVMARIPNSDPAKIPSLLRHMSVGGLILACTLLRLYLGKKKPRPPPMSSGMPWADRLASIVHRLLDILVLVMAGSGIALAVFSGLPAIILEGQNELLVNLDTHPLRAFHAFMAKVLAGVLALHAGGALYHQFILRDGLLSRMGFGREKNDGGSHDSMNPAENNAGGEEATSSAPQAGSRSA